MPRLPELIDTPAALDALTARLAEAPRIAVDIESNGFHAYHTRVCLIQLSAGGGAWAVDTLAVPRLTPLWSIFADPRSEKIFHAADGDLLSLRRDYDAGVANVFDTMIAARLTGAPRFGLADLLAEHFSVTLDKRFQRHDWGRRPIPAPALHYALADVRYLEALRDLLAGRLAERDQTDEAAELFERVTHVMPEAHDFDPEGFWRIKGARDLDAPARAVLRELYLYRDARARAQDRQPVRVMSVENLLALSRLLPADHAALREAGLSPLQIERYGRHLLQIIRRARSEPPPSPPRPTGERPDPVVIARYDALRAWRKERAAVRGIDPEMVITNAPLQALAREQPRDPESVARVAGLGPWRANAYAAELLATLQAPVDLTTLGKRHDRPRDGHAVEASTS